MAINDDTGNEIGDDFSQVLLREIAILRPQTHDPKQSAQECAGQAQLVGLALSGGGIRSATFNLGVI